MKKELFFTMAIVPCLTSVAWAQDLPKQLSFSRYEQMLDHSPFAVATATSAATTPDFARDLFIANAAHSIQGDFVTLASTTDNNFKKYLTSKAPEDGFSISNIEWSERVGETKVTISKDGQFATLTFNQALLSEPLPPGGGGPRPLSPMLTATPANIGRIQPAPIPMLPTPPNHIRGMIPRNPLMNNGKAAMPEPPPPRPLEHP